MRLFEDTTRWSHHYSDSVEKRTLIEVVKQVPDHNTVEKTDHNRKSAGEASLSREGCITKRFIVVMSVMEHNLSIVKDFMLEYTH